MAETDRHGGETHRERDRETERQRQTDRRGGGGGGGGGGGEGGSLRNMHKVIIITIICKNNKFQSHSSISEKH